MSSMIVENLVSGYGQMEVLHDLSIEIEEGQIASVLGPNGAGKTTLLRSIFGLIKPQEGRIIFRDDDITGYSPDRLVQMGLCYVPQEENIFPLLTVMENLEMGAFIRNDDIKPRMEEVFDLFPDLHSRRKSHAGELSGGMRQMLAIGRALMLNPSTLMLDEPSTGLAPFLVDNIFERVQELNKTGVTILLVEQNAGKVLPFSDKAYILEGGEKKAEGSGQELLADEEIGKLYLGR
jgi:ABC-type branched-subunit amino acid transport system ATPase component